MTENKPSAEHRAQLERRLLARFDQLHPQTEENPMKNFARLHGMKIGFGAVLLLALGAAAQAPVDLSKQVGTRVEIEKSSDLRFDPDQLRKAILALQEEPQGGFGGPQKVMREVQVRQVRSGDAFRIEIDLFGEPLAPDAEDRLRAALPQLSDATIRIAPIEASVRTTMAGKLAHDLLGEDLAGVSAKELERRVKEELRAQGEKGDVDVRVSDDGGKRRVEVRVKKEQAH